MGQDKRTRVVDIENVGRLGHNAVTTYTTGERVKRIRHIDVVFPVKNIVSARIETYGCPFKIDPDTNMPNWDVECVQVRSIMMGRISLWRHLKFWWRSRGK